ncbi:helix-turn-helix transcriptional regulator [Flavobacteriaceae bacterium TK19130]|nr:helix-turn-helix transcriptional regulator [Thermobacterium salinum]
MRNELNNERYDKNDQSNLEEAYASLKKSFRNFSENASTLSKIKQEIVAQQIPVLNSFFTGLGTSAVSVFDLEEKRFLYVEDAIEDVTGISKDTYLKKGIKYLFSRVAYDNIPSLLKSTLHEWRFLSKLEPYQYSNYIVNREYAYRQRNGKRWILQQTIKHLRNHQGKIFAIVTLETNIDHLKFDGKYRYYIYDRNLNKIVHPENRNQIDITFNTLSKREKEVVELLALGYVNKDVAKKLCISYHTVRTHRKNIFKKLGCSNIMDLARCFQNLPS